MAQLARIEKVVILQSSDLFAICKAEEVLRIATIAHERTFDANETIYEINDAANTLYCVVHGKVRLESARGEVQSAGPLNCFGVLEILTGRLRSSVAVAEEETRVLTINVDDFFDMLSRNVEIVKALFRQLLFAEDATSPLPETTATEGTR